MEKIESLNKKLDVNKAIVVMCILLVITLLTSCGYPHHHRRGWGCHLDETGSVTYNQEIYYAAILI